MICPLCGSELARRKGKYGDFMGCSSYPDCKFTAPVDEVEERIRKIDRAHSFLEKRHNSLTCRKCCGAERAEKRYNILYHKLMDEGALSFKELRSIQKYLVDRSSEREEYKYPPLQSLTEEQKKMMEEMREHKRLYEMEERTS